VDILVHQNIRLSHVIFSDTLDLDYLPRIFHLLDHVTTKTLSERLEVLTDWEGLHDFASNLISPRIDINSGVEADKAALEFTASTYRLSASEIKLSELNSDIPSLGRLL
jgi:hypothetical protein